MASQGIMANQRAAGSGGDGPNIGAATATPGAVWIDETFFSGESKVIQTGTLNVPAATATPEDVWSGKTFFAGESREMQTGTLTGATVTKYASGSAHSINGSQTISLNFDAKMIVAHRGANMAFYYNGTTDSTGVHSSYSEAWGTLQFALYITSKPTAKSFTIQDSYPTSYGADDIIWYAYGY